MNKSSLRRCQWWPLLLVLAFSATELIADENGGGEKSVRQQRLEFVQSNAARHRIATADNPRRAFELRRAPLIYWTNPIRGDVEGGIFLWVDDRRPVAYAGIFVWLDEANKRLAREFHTLTEDPLVAEFDRQRVWSPGSGIQYHEIPNPVKVGPLPATRLRQMKQLASRFSVTISHPTEESDKVRLLPTPLYRYGDEQSEVLDGAIFAFAQGNDPEALLMIEAYSEGRGKQPKWRYAWARCTTWSVEAKLSGKKVFQVPYYDFRRHDPNAVFLSAPWISLQ